MSNETSDHHLSISIGEKLRVLSPISSDCSITRVPAHLRKVNEKAYEPRIIAIGPYHRGKNHLATMEQHKIRYLKAVLQRRGEKNVVRYVTAMRALEVRARKCYGEYVSLEADEFVETMLLDGCFIIEVLRKCTITNYIGINDPIFKGFRINCTLRRDLLLVENQLPFFILSELFGMTAMPYEEHNLVHLISNFITSFSSMSIKTCSSTADNEYSTQEATHLLGFIHDNLLLSSSGLRNRKKEGHWKFIRCATYLQEAGIKLEKVEGDISLFDIKFEYGIMKIPTLQIEDDTESFFRNLIAYEQFSLQDGNLNYVTDYVTFMDCLINSRKDVELLSQRGIITNWLGKDKVAAKMFNRFGDSVILFPQNFCYSQLFNEVNKHCSKRWNKWITNLRHRYFYTPWAFISSLAVFLMLLSAFLQTLFSVLAYFK